MNNEKKLIDSAVANGLLQSNATQLLEVQNPSWAITITSFIGSWFAIIPIGIFLGFFSYEFFFQPPVSFIMAAACLSIGIFGLRQQTPIFIQHLSFCFVIIGIAFAVFSFIYLQLGEAVFVLWFALQLGVALSVRNAWVQTILGFGLVVPILLLSPELILNSPQSDESRIEEILKSFPQISNAIVLAIAWAFWCASEIRLSGKRFVASTSALVDGIGVALLLAQILASRSLFFDFGPSTRQGSADVAHFGEGSFFVFDWVVGIQSILTVVCCVWAVSWVRRANIDRTIAVRTIAFVCVMYLVLLLFGFFTRDGGVVVVVITAALVTSRFRMFAFGIAVLLAQLSGFYYALSWTLTAKALLLAVIGLALGSVVLAIRTFMRSDVNSDRAAPINATASSIKNGAYDAIELTDKSLIQTMGLVFVGGVIALGGVNYDVFKKEQVISTGQRIYIALAPRDPRSIMQGDYMALNFGFDRFFQLSNSQENPKLFLSDVKVVASLNDNGVATVLRLANAVSTEVLAKDEILLPLKHKGNQWVLVTDAFYFPEGQGEPFKKAKFGEFRALADGRALLVGLTDENLMPIVPARIIDSPTQAQPR
jgi:uncharacterized membrane-anchored protein